MKILSASTYFEKKEKHLEHNKVTLMFENHFLVKFLTTGPDPVI